MTGRKYIYKLDLFHDAICKGSLNMAGFMITVALENVERRKMTVILFCWKFLFGGLRRFLAHGGLLS